MIRIPFVILTLLLFPTWLSAEEQERSPAPPICVAVVNGLNLHGPWPALAAGFAGQAKIETLGLRRDEAIDALEDGSADAALVHESPDLKLLVESGLIETPIPWAYSGYMLTGPADDPAKASIAATASAALKLILAAKSPVLLPEGRGAAAKWAELLAPTGLSVPAEAPTADPEKSPLEQAAALKAYTLIPRQSDLLEAAPALKMICLPMNDPALRNAFVMLIRKNSPQAAQAKALAAYLTSAAAAPLFAKPAGRTGRWLEIFPQEKPNP